MRRADDQVAGGGKTRGRRARFEVLEERRLLDAVPQLVKDIGVIGLGSDPGNLTNVNGTLFFRANDDQLWKSDGTAGGTVLVKDIQPGNSGYYIQLASLTNVNGTLFFGATDGI